MNVTLNSDTETLERLAKQLHDDGVALGRLSSDPVTFLQGQGIAVDAETASRIQDRLARGKSPIAASAIHIDA